MSSTGTSTIRSVVVGTFAALLATTACNPIPAAPSDEPQAPESAVDAQTVLEQVAELLAHRPFTADEVSSALGVDLDKQASSTRYFDVYRSTSPTAAFSTVEVRQPTPESKGKGGMLLLDWSGECVTREQVGDRFGATEPGPPWMPRPPQPADSPRYDTHPQDWGEVRLGYDPDSGCLEKIVADANG